MTHAMQSKAISIAHEQPEEWSEITPGERYILRVSSDETNGAYSMIEIVAEYRNGTPEHVHLNEDEHFVILEGKAHFSNGGRRMDLTAGSTLTVPKGVRHAWCCISETPLRMLILFSPGGIDEMFREAAKADNDLDSFTHILQKFATRITGPALFDNVYTKASPRS